MNKCEAACLGLDQLPSDLLRVLVTSALKQEGWQEDHQVFVHPGSSKGDNFMGDMYRVSTRIGAREFSIVLKCVPLNEQRRKFFDLPNLYKNEINFYKKVVVHLPGGLNLAVPKCLVTNWDGNDSDALILEDLKPRGYQLLPRASGLGVAHYHLVLQELARLHASSFALKVNNPQQFAQLASNVKDLFFDEDRKQNFEPYIESSNKEYLRVMAEFFNDQEHCYLRKMKELVANGYDRVASIIRSTRENERVITHGDCWIGNLLFKLNDNTKEPTNVCILDFQLSRLTSPAADLVYSMYTSVQPNVFSRHYDTFLDTYHTCLTAALDELNVNVENVFPRSRLDHEMVRCAPYGLAMAGIVVPAVYCPTELTPDLDAVKGDSPLDFVQAYEKMMKANTYECRVHLANLLQFCTDRGYLD